MKRKEGFTEVYTETKEGEKIIRKGTRTTYPLHDGNSDGHFAFYLFWFVGGAVVFAVIRALMLASL